MRFLAAHPFCCFCGGSEPSATIDHVPNRAAFKGRVGPEGFEFPACEACNASCRDVEQVFAFYARVLDESEANYNAEYIGDRLAGVRNNFPALLPSFEISTNEKRRVLREMGVDIPRGQFIRDVPLIGVPVEFEDAVSMVARKLACALHYRELRKIVPPSYAVTTHWTQIQHPSAEPLITSWMEMLPNFQMTSRRNTNIGNQFCYIWGANTAEKLFAYSAQFGLGLCLFAAIAPPRDRPVGEWKILTRPFS